MRLPCLLASLLVTLPLAAPARPATARTLWTGPAGSTVYAAPSSHAVVVAIVPSNQPLRLEVAGARWRSLVPGGRRGRRGLGLRRRRHFHPGPSSAARVAPGAVARQRHVVNVPAAAALTRLGHHRRGPRRRTDPPVRGGGPLTRRLLWRARAGGAAAGGPPRRHPRARLGLPVPGRSSGRRSAEHRRGALCRSVGRPAGRPPCRRGGVHRRGHRARLRASAARLARPG